MRATHAPLRQLGFSLIEVVLALGVVAIGVIAILGVLPGGFDTALVAQHEVRAQQIAQRLLADFSSQPFTAVRFAHYGFDGGVDSDVVFDLSQSSVTPPFKGWWANSKGVLFDDGLTSWNRVTAPSYFYYLDKPGDPTQASSGAEKFPTYRITITFDNPSSPPEVADSANSKRVTVRVAWRPEAQNFRDFVRLVRR